MTITKSRTSKYVKAAIIPGLCVIASMMPKKADACWEGIGYLLAGFVSGAVTAKVADSQPTTVYVEQPTYVQQQPVYVQQPTTLVSTPAEPQQQTVVRRVVQQRRVVEPVSQQPVYIQHTTPQGQVYYTLEQPVQGAQVIQTTPVTTQTGVTTYQNGQIYQY